MKERNNGSSTVPPEALPSKERLKPLFSVLTISGRSGTGKTEAAKILARKYGIPEDKKDKRFIKTGEMIRDIVGGSMVGYGKRDISVDRKIDEMQAELIQTSTADTPIILEGRLAGIIASEEKKKASLRKQTLPVVSILFTANSDVRYPRILRRDKKNDPTLTLNKVKRLSIERETGDLKTWRKLHPQLRNIDPFNTANRDSNGNRIYDFIISTTKIPVEKVAEEIDNWLRREGFVARI